jgi:hypothetical protein
MEQTASQPDFAPLAQATAQQVGWAAVRWWQASCDPRFLHIEAIPQDRTVAEPPIVTLHAFLS